MAWHVDRGGHVRVGEAHEVVVEAGAGVLRGADDLGGVEADRGRGSGRVEFGADADRRGGELRGAFSNGHGHEAGSALLDDRAIVRLDPVGRDGGDRRADRGVPGERQFLRRSEDPRAIVGARRGRREHEHGLGVVELEGDRLHPRW